MNVALFTDHDVHQSASVAAQRALLATASDVHLKVYTAAPMAVDDADYVALTTIGGVPRFSAYVSHVRRSGADLVHVDAAGRVGLTGLYVAWRLRLPLVGSIHAVEDASRARWLYARCARLLVPSQHARELLIATGICGELVDVCGPGVDATVFSPSRRSGAIRERWHVSERRPAIACIAGTLDERRARSLGALRDRLHGRGIEHALVLVGHDPVPDAFRHRLGDAVFTGPLSSDERAATLASADLAIIPPSGKPMAAAVLEAQASGLPVVVEGTSDAREYIVAGVTGLVCHGDVPEDWAHAAAMLLRTPVLRHAMRGRAREHAARKTWSDALHSLAAVYRETVSRPALEADDRTRVEMTYDAPRRISTKGAA